jgi:hypothetical protein
MGTGTIRISNPEVSTDCLSRQDRLFFVRPESESTCSNSKERLVEEVGFYCEQNTIRRSAAKNLTLTFGGGKMACEICQSIVRPCEESKKRESQRRVTCRDRTQRTWNFVSRTGLCDSELPPTL